MIPVKILPDIFGTGIPGMLEHEVIQLVAIELVMVVVVEIIPFKSIIGFGLKLLLVVVLVVLEEEIQPELLDSVILVIVANA